MLMSRQDRKTTPTSPNKEFVPVTGLTCRRRGPSWLARCSGRMNGIKFCLYPVPGTRLVPVSRQGHLRKASSSISIELERRARWARHSSFFGKVQIAEDLRVLILLDNPAVEFVHRAQLVQYMQLMLHMGKSPKKVFLRSRGGSSSTFRRPSCRRVTFRCSWFESATGPRGLRQGNQNDTQWSGTQ